MNDAVFSQIDFGPLKEFLEEDNITDVSYSNGGQVWLKTLDKGVYILSQFLFKVTPNPSPVNHNYSS